MRFEECASDYDSNAAPQRAFALKVSEFAACAENEDVLELGAGTGTLTKLLCAIPGARVMATDLSPAMVAIGRAAAPGAQWTVLNAFRDTVPPSRLQISSGLLQWAPDPGEALRLWAAGLGSHGRMVHAFPCEPCLREWRKIAPHSPVVWRDMQGWADIFENAGLRVNRHALWVEQHSFPSALDMLRTMHRSGVTGRTHLNPGQLRRCLRTYEREHSCNGGVSATWAWLAIEALR